MKRTRILLIVNAILAIPEIVSAQQSIVYNQYFFNPFLYNPSLIASHERTELFLNYRKQWMGIQDSPSTALVNLQVPINYKMAIGATAIQDNIGVVHTTTGMLAFGYHIYFGNNAETGHKIGFGLSAGISNSRLNMDKVTNPNDPALGGNSTSSMNGQFGFNYHFRNFRAGFALPSIFKNDIASEENFSSPGIDQLSTTLSTLSYTFPMTQRVSFEPTLLYRSEPNSKQLEGMGVVKIDELFWVGGSYRQNYGASAFFQISIKDKIKVGYNYEFATGRLNGFNNASHEFQIILNLGKKKSEPVTKEGTHQEEVAITETEPVQKQIKQDAKPSEELVPPPAVPAKPPANQVADEKALKKDMNPKKLNGEYLDRGYYIVVGVFFSVINANKYYNTLKKVGYPAAIGFYPPRNYYIIYMKKTDTIEEAKKSRDEYRARSRYSFKDTWIFFVE